MNKPYKASKIAKLSAAGYDLLVKVNAVSVNPVESISLPSVALFNGHQRSLCHVYICACSDKK
jgi:hypothetical protein